MLLGTGMLWFGWFGFNAGSAVAANGTATLAFATTNTASASAMLGWMFFDWLRGNKPSALGACIGAVVGLVAITPAAGFVTVRESIIIGLVASVISNLAVHIRTKSTLDDTLDVFPCHGIGGMVGMLATGIFADKGLADIGFTSPDDGKMPMFVAHLIALVVVSAFAFFGSLILFKITDLIIPLRVTPEQEEVGLDLSQHGETALGADLLGGVERPRRGPRLAGLQRRLTADRATGATRLAPTRRPNRDRPTSPTRGRRPGLVSRPLARPGFETPRGRRRPSRTSPAPCRSRSAGSAAHLMKSISW